MRLRTVILAITAALGVFILTQPSPVPKTAFVPPTPPSTKPSLLPTPSPGLGDASDDPADVAVPPRRRSTKKRAAESSAAATAPCRALTLNATTAKALGILGLDWCMASTPAEAGDATCPRGAQLRIQLGASARWSPSDDPPRALSSNQTLSRLIARRFGPLMFRLRLEAPGADALLLTPQPTDGNAYLATMPEMLRGREYVVALEALYDRFYAADEKTNHWPPLLKWPVLAASPTAKDTNYHVQQLTLRSVDSVAACSSRAVEMGDNRDSARAAAAALITTDKSAPRCSSDGRFDAGRWVVASAETVATRVRVRKIQRNPIVFQWAIQHDYDWRWQRAGCRSRRMKHERMMAALRGKRIVIGGDSQLRALYYGVVNVLLGHEWSCVRNLTTVASEPSQCVQNVKGSQRRSIDGTQVDYVDDLFLEKFMGDRYNDYDFVIVGFAQHPASKEHWTLDKYRGAVHAKARRIKQLRQRGSDDAATAKPTHVIWYGAPQYPHTTNGYPVVVRDWRTDARLQLFNEAAFAAMRELGVPTVDAFAVTTGMSHTSPDQAHFSNFVCAELVNVVFDAICDQLPAGACDDR